MSYCQPALQLISISTTLLAAIPVYIYRREYKSPIDYLDHSHTDFLLAYLASPLWYQRA